MTGYLGPWPGNPDGGNPNPDTSTPDGPPDDFQPAIPWVADAPDLYDQITIAGVTLRGLVRFTGELGRKLDVKNAKGADGATITDDGADPETIEIEYTMWTREQWFAWQQFVPIVNPAAQKGKLKPVDVDHPIFALHGIKSIYVEKLAVPTQGRLAGTLQTRIRAIGWRPEPKSTTSKSSTPKSSDPSKDYVWGENNTDPKTYQVAESNSGPTDPKTRQGADSNSGR